MKNGKRHNFNIFRILKDWVRTVLPNQYLILFSN